MSRTLELPDDLAEELSQEASQLGMSLADYALHVLKTSRTQQVKVTNGRELIAYWRREQILGARNADNLDSSVAARQLREQVQQRRSTDE